jgi:hypothetical protein
VVERWAAVAAPEPLRTSHHPQHRQAARQNAQVPAWRGVSTPCARVRTRAGARFRSSQGRRAPLVLGILRALHPLAPATRAAAVAAARRRPPGRRLPALGRGAAARSGAARLARAPPRRPGAPRLCRLCCRLVAWPCGIVVAPPAPPRRLARLAGARISRAALDASRLLPLLLLMLLLLLLLVLPRTLLLLLLLLLLPRRLLPALLRARLPLVRRRRLLRELQRLIPPHIVGGAPGAGVPRPLSGPPSAAVARQGCWGLLPTVPGPASSGAAGRGGHDGPSCPLRADRRRPRGPVCLRERADPPRRQQRRRRHLRRRGLGPGVLLPPVLLRRVRAAAARPLACNTNKRRRHSGPGQAKHPPQEQGRAALDGRPSASEHAAPHRARAAPATDCSPAPARRGGP